MSQTSDRLLPAAGELQENRHGTSRKNYFSRQPYLLQVVIFFVFLCLLQGSSSAGASTEDLPRYTVTKAVSQIEVDAVLDEAAWQDALTLELPFEIDPGENTPSPVRTEFLITYDDNNLYIAFRAYDPEPSKIRAHVTDRDTPWQDDFVGIMFDPFNDERRGFELFVNPMGVQMDLSRNEVGNGDQEDHTWDAIWESAGKIDHDGYIVEMGVPFSSLRFPRTDGPQTWGMFPFRAYPRSVRHQLSFVPFDRDVNCFFCQAPKFTGFEGITPGRNLEFDPTFTSLRTDTLGDTGNSLLSGDPDTEVGLSMRWGFTPNLSLNGALNPDFSQVEADVAQLDINNRFALFYEERRPFFLEGADFFDTPLQAIYTRTVADPDLGIKLAGKEGKSAIGAYVAKDNQNNLLFPSNQSSDTEILEQDVTSGVFRYRRDVGRNSTFGGLLTIREGEGYHNRVYGADGHFRFTSKDGLRVQLLGSDTAYPGEITNNEDFDDQPDDPFKGYGLRAFYLHESRNLAWWGLYQNKSPNFRTDAGFMPRVDTRSFVGGAEHTRYPEGDSWFTRMHFGTEFEHTTDHDGLLTDQRVSLWYGVGGPMQMWLNPSFDIKKEYYDGVTYDLTNSGVYFGTQPTGDLNLWCNFRFGDAIDFDNSQPATRIWGGPGGRYYMGRHLQLWVDSTFEFLNVGGGRLFNAYLTQMRVVYQLNTKTFVRAIVQYTHVNRNTELYDEPDDFAARSRDVFSQLLFSYKINPRTVLFLGYSDNYDDSDRRAVIRTDRTFFLKIGYAWLV